MTPNTKTPTLYGGPFCGAEIKPEDNGPRIVINDALRKSFHIYQRSVETGRHYYFFESMPHPTPKDGQ